MRNLCFPTVMAAFFLIFIMSGTAAPPPQAEAEDADHALKGMPRYDESYYTQLPQRKRQEPEGRDTEHNRKGMQHFNEAFYRKLPQGRNQEAARSFDLAAEEFQNAIAANPNDAQARRNLARLYYVRKQFPQAAQAYATLTILEPQDIDLYLQLALCYTHLDQFDMAVQELEIAKTKTGDSNVIEKLNDYIRKIKEHGQD